MLHDNFLFRTLAVLMAINTTFWSWFKDKPLWVNIVIGVGAAVVVWFVMKIITGLIFYVVLAGLILVAVGYFKAE